MRSNLCGVKRFNPNIFLLQLKSFEIYICILPGFLTRMNSIPYALAIRLIIYAMLCTMSNMAYALGIVSRFQVDLREDH